MVIDASVPRFLSASAAVSSLFLAKDIFFKKRPRQYLNLKISEVYFCECCAKINFVNTFVPIFKLYGFLSNFSR